MSTFTDEDETLIQKFIGLQISNNTTPKVLIPYGVASSIAWDLCMMAKIVTNKSVMDGPFSTVMIQAWGTDPGTLFEGVARNSYLIEFKNEKDMCKAITGGPWTFRGDLVATKKVNSHLDLHPNYIDQTSLC